MKKKKTMWAWFDTLYVLAGVLGCAYVLYLSFYRSWYYLFLVPPFLLFVWIGDIGTDKIITRIEENIKCWKDADAKAKDSKANLHKKEKKAKGIDIKRKREKLSPFLQRNLPPGFYLEEEGDDFVLLKFHNPYNQTDQTITIFNQDRVSLPEIVKAAKSFLLKELEEQ